MFAILAACPSDPLYMEVVSQATSLIRNTSIAAKFADTAKDGCRGFFGAGSAGFSHGGGQTKLTNISMGHHANMMNGLLMEPCMQKMSIYAFCMFASI